MDLTFDRMFNPVRYGPLVAELLAKDRVAPLGPGTPNLSMKPKLESLRAETLFTPHPIQELDMARACLAGLWLYHDFLDESHSISQEIATPTGSFWHGIMHRREPDPSNSKYWWRRVGKHPVFADLAEQAAKVGYLQTGTVWDPFAFVDSCEEHRGSGSEAEWKCRWVQHGEWELLFEWCYRQATGRDA
jgi:hypothetical protein